MPTTDVVRSPVATLFDQARAFAEFIHAGQVDKQGRPYMAHVMGVVYSTPASVRHGNVIAVLHDVVEDAGELRPVVDAYLGTLPVEIEAAVRILTRDPGVDYMTYVDEVKRHPVAREVKIADLRCNLQNTSKIPNSLAERYRRALVRLTEET